MDIKSIDDMTESEFKVHENRLRRMADRQGLRLVKSRTRDPLAQNYGVYWLVDKQYGFEATKCQYLDEIESYLTEPL